MISENQLRELLAQKTETKNLDFKESCNWNTAGNDEKYDLVKDILAFMNTQDGGQIIIGVENSTFKVLGISADEFASFDTTKVNDFLHRYTDPLASCEVQKLTVDGFQVVVLGIPEFQDVPIICKRDANSGKDSSKLILKAGGLYVRTEKATSVLVPSVEEMRDLLNRALFKRGDQLLSMMRGLLQGNSSAPEQTEEEKYQQEIASAYEYFREVLPSDFETVGYWELVAMPHLYRRERIPNITSVRKALADSEVRFRGWTFPHINRDGQSSFDSGRQSWTKFMHHVEAHRAYQSGLLVWRGSYWENSSHFKKEHEYALSFVNVIYTVTEFIVFLKRYYERVSPDAIIRFSIEMTHIKDRALEATDWNEIPFLDAPKASVPDLNVKWDYSVSELRASVNEIAIAVVQRIFEIFNWDNPDPAMIQSFQEKLLTKKL